MSDNTQANSHSTIVRNPMAQPAKTWLAPRFRLPFVPVQDSRFPPTSWSLIVRAGADTPEGKQALNELCRAYRPAILAFIRRHKRSSEDAEDSVQAFFANLLRRKDIAKFDPSRGSKFRSWLLGCVKHHLFNENDYDQIHISPENCDNISSDSIDSLEHHVAIESRVHDVAADRLYDQQFALALLARVFEKLQATYYAEPKKKQRFKALLGTITQDAVKIPYGEIARTLGMKPNAVKQAASQLRGRYQKTLRDEVAIVVNADRNDAAVDAEIMALLLAVIDPP